MDIVICNQADRSNPVCKKCPHSVRHEVMDGVGLLDPCNIQLRGCRAHPDNSVDALCVTPKDDNDPSFTDRK